MTKKELIKYLQSEKEERIAQLKQHYESLKAQAKQNAIETYKLNVLAQKISEQCEKLLDLYKEYIENAPCNHSRYYHSHAPKECLAKLTDEDLAEWIREEEGIGDDVLEQLDSEYKEMKRQVERSYAKLEVYVQDCVKASDAIEYLTELGFDLKIKVNNIKTEINPDILFGKKED